MKQLKKLIKKIKYKLIYTFVLINLQSKGVYYPHAKIMAQQVAYFKVYG